MDKTVADYICCLERVFQVAYGTDNLTHDTHNAFLYGQMGLTNANVSGALTYHKLFMAARNEDKRQARLKKQQNIMNKHLHLVH